ncbi:MAG: gamma carbonic anhydrase family protein [Syntrophales bacterium]|nr:gamma carbonic anhydrase family protein [Syntrophales bacterium]
MIRGLGDTLPKIAQTAFISEAAYVVGDVEIGEHSSVWPGAVIRGDYAKVIIGEYVHLEDNCVVHCGTPLVIGSHIIVGHGAVVHCATIGDNVLVGSNATILDRAEIGDSCIIGAGSLVTPDTIIPPRSLVVGVPATVKGQVTDEQIRRLRADVEGYYAYALQYKNQGL